MPMVANMQPTTTTISGTSSIRSGGRAGRGRPGRTRIDGGRQDQLAGLLDTGVAPHAAVEAEDVVGDQGDDHAPRGGTRRSAASSGPGLVAEVGDLGQAVAGDDAEGVEQDEDDPGPDPAGEHGKPLHVRPGFRLAGIARFRHGLSP